MHRNISLTAGVSFVLLVAAGATVAACGGSDSGGSATPAAVATSTKQPPLVVISTPSPAAPNALPTATASGPTPSVLGFGCPTQWQPYVCPAIPTGAGGLTAPYRAGVNAEMMCQNIGFYTSGVQNDVSILYKLPPGTEIVAPFDAPVISVRSSPAPHEYTKSIALGAKPFLIYLYFIGDPKVEANTSVARGDVLAVSTGTFPTDSPPDSKLLGASLLINLLGYDSIMLDASSSDLWIGGVASCYAP